MPEGGELTISTHEVPEGVALSFADTGPGIPEAQRDRVFEPFYTTKPQGTGMGLPMCYTIIEQHGGTITVEDAPQGGALIRVILPAVEEEAGEEI